MGICNSDNKNEIDNQRQKKRNSWQNDQSKKSNDNTKKTENKDNVYVNANKPIKKLDEITIADFHRCLLDDEFKDMEIWSDEIYVGEGIKRDKGYKSTLKIDELNEKRNKFWSKILKKERNSEIIKTIRTSCYVDNGNFFD